MNYLAKATWSLNFKICARGQYRRGVVWNRLRLRLAVRDIRNGR